MTQFFVGISHVIAWREAKYGIEGYSLRYTDGRADWQNQEQFERTYLPLGENNPDGEITDNAIADLIAEKISTQVEEGLFCVRIVLKYGIEIVEYANTEEDAVGECYHRIHEFLRHVIAWAKYGLTKVYVY